MTDDVRVDRGGTVPGIAPTEELDNELLPLAISGVLGTAVVVAGPDVAGEPAVAVWQVNPGGAPTGAWVVAEDVLRGDREAARRLLSCVDGRAVTGSAAAEILPVLRRLAESAHVEIDPAWWVDRLFTPFEVLTDIANRRRRYEGAVDARRVKNKSVSMLEWGHDLDLSNLPEDFDSLLRLSSLARAGGAPVVAEALTISRVLRWLVEIWSETEQVKNRRSYLGEEFGSADPLPQTWMDPMKMARRTRLPL